MLVRRGARPRRARAELTVELADFQFQDEAPGRRFELAGSASVKDPSARGGGRFQVSTLRASIADVTWPVVRPAAWTSEQRPGRGPAESHRPAEPAPPPASFACGSSASISASGRASRRAPPRRGPRGSQSANRRAPRSRGAEPCARRDRGQSARGQGCARGAAAGPRVEAKGIEVDGLAARRTAARHHRAPGHDRAGQHRGHRPAVGPARSGRARAAGAPPAAPAAPLALAVGEILVKDGGLVWRDRAVKPDVALEFAGLEAKVTGVAWPSMARASDGGAPAGRRPGRVRRPGGCRSDHRGGAGDRQRR